MSHSKITLAGKTALVTGSGRENGIGAAIARALASHGADVAIHYVSDGSKSRAEQVATSISQEFGTRTTIVQGAVERFENSDKIVKEALEGLNTDHIDILVNNAGVGDLKSLLQVKPEDFESQFAVNVFGTAYLTQSVVNLGKMPKGGRIINIGSIASKQSISPGGVYSAAKAAQDSLTASWAGELGVSHGITVNTIAPGPVLTDLARSILENEDGSASSMQAAMFASTRGGARLGTADDVADAVLLVASEQSRWITAQWISVSGGITGTM